MNQSSTVSTGRSTIQLNRIKTYFSKPHNVILLIMGIVPTVTTVAPIVAIVQDTFKIHAGTIDAHLTGQASGYTLVNYIDLFTSRLAMSNLWMPLINTVLLAVGTCVVAIVFGGLFAFLITHEPVLPQIPQLHLHLPLHHAPVDAGRGVADLFNSNAVWHVNGLLAATLGVQMPLWWCKNLFPSLVVLGLHYAPFAYILIGGIFRNMDANLEEAATILDTPSGRPCSRSRCPWSSPPSSPPSCWCSAAPWAPIPCPTIWSLTTLATKYVSLNSKYTGEASILAIIMTSLRRGHHVPESDEPAQPEENYTTVTGKSGQTSKINLGRAGKYIIAAVLIVITFFTSIFPIVSFAFETFLPNPGDYSFLYTGDADNLTVKWWTAGREHHGKRNVRPEGHPAQRDHLARLPRNDPGVRVLLPAGRHHRHHDRLRRIQDEAGADGRTTSTRWPSCRI